MNGLVGMTAYVTGGGSGIGRATSLRLASEGARVAVVDRNLEAAQAVAKEIDTEGGTAAAIHCDVTVADSVEASFRVTATQLGPQDFIVNCAGVALGEGGVVTCPEDAWDLTMNVNVKSIFLTGKYGLPTLVDKGAGAVVNIASVFGFTVNKDECAYAASKGAVINLTRQMALQHATDGVRVNAICPSDTDTPLIANLLGVSGAELESEKKKLTVPIPMGRLADPRDIAAGVAYLLSSDAAFVTGVSLPVDGGFLIQ